MVQLELPLRLLLHHTNLLPPNLHRLLHPTSRRHRRRRHRREVLSRPEFSSSASVSRFSPDETQVITIVLWLVYW